MEGLDSTRKAREIFRPRHAHYLESCDFTSGGLNFEL
jgi:hypothetical protein